MKKPLNSVIRQLCPREEDQGGECHSFFLFSFANRKKTKILFPALTKFNALGLHLVTTANISSTFVSRSSLKCLSVCFINLTSHYQYIWTRLLEKKKTVYGLSIVVVFDLAGCSTMANLTWPLALHYCRDKGNLNN